MRLISILFTFFFFITFALQASDKPQKSIPEELLLNEPSCIVNHSVNVITGHYQENEIDIEVAGPHPLIFQRSHISGDYGNEDIGKCWHTNHVGSVHVSPTMNGVSTASVKGDLGAFSKLEGEIPGNKKKPIKFKPVQGAFNQYMTNCPDFCSLAGGHARNNRIYYVKKQSVLSLVTGTSFLRSYKNEKKKSKHFFLDYESNPNGCILRYGKGEKRKVTLENKNGNPLSSLEIDTTNKKLVTVTGSDGKWVKYHLEYAGCPKCRPVSYHLSSVEGSNIPSQTYIYSTNKEHGSPKIAVKHLPDGRYLSNEYYKGKRHNQNGSDRVWLDDNDVRKDRVMFQKAPVGPDAHPIFTHRYYYNLRIAYDEFDNPVALGGVTTVFDAHNHKTDYIFNDDYRITDIWRWGEGNKEVHSIEKSFWGKNGTTNSTNLISRTLAGGDNGILLCRSYLYDDFGNATYKFLWGNLTGRQPGYIITDPMGNPFPCTEHHITGYTYSSGPQSLLLSENDGKKIIDYSYYPNTNLIANQLTKVDGIVKKREFKGYDDNSCLNYIIVDDGTGQHEYDHSYITERHITLIYNKTTAPLGLPEIVEQKYMDFDLGQHFLQGKVHNKYSSKGELLSQEHYDSEGVLRFTLEWDYDDKGNVIMEKDAMGKVIKKNYDQNKNLIYEEGPVSGLYKEFRYDFVNRLIGTTEVNPDGTQLINTFRYDYLGNRIASVDPYGQETHYRYDHQNRLIETILPIVLNEDMAPIQPSIKIEYDLFNNPFRITDAAGGKTIIAYTVRNKPYYKQYPDGTSERFEYDTDGTLRIATAKNGTKTVYYYDAFDRVIRKEFISPEGMLIQSETSEYNTFHLLSKTDPDGMLTRYTYDKAGKVASVTKGDMRTEHQYDTLGRESRVLTFYGTGKNDYTAKVKEYDLLKHVIEERSEDASGNILTREVYEYDFQGNRNVIRQYNQAGESITKTDYNTQGQIVSITNPMGEQTRIHYRYDYYDPVLGQNLPCIESTDPKGIVTVCIKDALGRSKTEYKKDPFGKLLQKRDFYYTVTNLLGRTVDAVIVDGEVKHEIVNLCKYDVAGKLIEAWEAAGTPEQKVTKFGYNACGQKETETKPDGNVLNYSYDALGRLKEYWDSSKSFHYVYEYDLNGNPIKVVDQISQTETLKEFDSYNHLIKETLANGFVLEYNYDLTGKPTKILFPDQSGMRMSYEGLLLKEVSRINEQGEKLYEHTYDAYDLSGNVLSSTLIGKAGKVSYEIDLNGRLTGIKTDAWEGTISKFDDIGNVTKRTSRDKKGSYFSEYSYDGLSQLTRETGDFSESYAFDSLYNRVRKGNCDYTLNTLNQITNDGKSTYKYDLNGNLIEIDNGDALVALTYDALNRLVKVEKGKQIFVYTYDEMNRRLSKTIFEQNAQKKSYKYFYQDLNEVGCYEDGRLTQLRLLGIGKGAEIGAAVAMEFDNTVYAPIHDFQGNVMCLVDAMTGNVKEFYRYSAFGEESLYDEYGKTMRQASINPWRFSSKRFDNETGYVYFGRRYYDSGFGRWITPDPIGYEGGPNLYAYVLNNPFGSIDLYGLSPEESASVQGNERSFFDGVKDFFCSAYEGIRDGVVGICSSICENLSRVTSALCDTFSSYREERQVVFNQRMFQSAMNRNPPMTYYVGIGRYLAIYFANGMCTPLETLLSHGDMLYGLAKGVIGCIHNPTNGFFHDLGRVFHSLNFYIASASIMELHNDWNTHFAIYGRDFPILQNCHSEGVANVRNALMCYDPELRNMIDVVAIAPAAYIEKDLCRSVVHYVSTRDFVPWFDVRGRMNNQDTIRILKPHKDAKLWDHDFQSPTYERAIRYHIHEHLKNIGRL